MSYLVLVRHGESRWNLSNRFTGWVDIPLSENGIYEALIAANNLKALRFDIAFTSKLTRAQETLMIILAEQDYTAVFMHDDGKEKHWSSHIQLQGKEIPVFESSALNERYYGKLQGLNKDDARKKYGKEKVFIWRRSCDIPPPGGESLKDTLKRTLPYFKREIVPKVKAGKNVLVSAHGNSLRAIIKDLDRISDADIPKLELPTGKPIIYEWKKGKFTKVEHIHTFNRPTHWKRHTPTGMKSRHKAKH